MKPYIRKQLGLKARRVTGVEPTHTRLLIRIDRLGRRRLRCGRCRHPAQTVGGLRPERRWRVTRALAGAVVALDLNRTVDEVRRSEMRRLSRRERTPFKLFVRLLEGHLDGLLAWTALRLSNGAPGRDEQQDQARQPPGFGFRSPRYFITAIYHCCAKLPLPAGR